MSALVVTLVAQTLWLLESPDPLADDTEDRESTGGAA